MKDIRTFIYKDSKNKVAVYMIDVLRDEENYLPGLDLKEEGKYKLFKKSRVIKYVEDFEKAEAEAKEIQKQYEIIVPRSYGSGGPRKVNLNKEGKFEVCFTGFFAKDKKRLSEKAESENMLVRGTVTTNLGLLVCGQNAGEKKIEKAEQKNISKVIGEEGFLNFLETGEVNED